MKRAKNMTVRVLLLGSSEFAVPIAEAFRASLVGIITQPDQPAGRGNRPSAPPLALWATERDIPLYQPTSKGAIATLVRMLHPDVAITAAYGRIIPNDALAIPRFGFLNIHPSLLPRWRGASPIQAAIAAGDAMTGVTIFKMDCGIDTGPIIVQHTFPITPQATRSSLERDLAQLAARDIVCDLTDYYNGFDVLKPQDNTHATTCPLLTREDGKIDWHVPAATIERKVRAYDGWPGTWTTLTSKHDLKSQISPPKADPPRAENFKLNTRLKILTALIDGKTDLAPATILRDPHGRMAVACGDGRTLILTRVQPEGKPPMGGEEFLRGHRDLSRFT